MDPLEKFISILPEGLDDKARLELIDNAEQRLDAGESINKIIDEYLAKRDPAVGKINNLTVTADGSGVVNRIEKNDN